MRTGLKTRPRLIMTYDDSIYYFEDYNGGMGKKYLITRGPSIPVTDEKGNVILDGIGRPKAYIDGPEKMTEVPRYKKQEATNDSNND